jgi:outer membrane protein assembly factor BamB
MLLKRFIGLSICVLLLASCANGNWFGKDKKMVEGERLRILPEAMDDRNVIGKQLLILPSSQPNYAWEPENNICNLQASFNSGYNSSINIELADVYKYNEIPFIVAQENLYIQNSAGSISAYNKLQELSWKTDLPGSVLGTFDKPALFGSMAADSDVLYVTFGDSRVAALNMHDGSQKWLTRLLSITRSKPVVYRNFVFIQTVDNKLVALEKMTGKVIWTHYGISKEGDVLHTTLPIILDDMVYVNYTSGDIVALKLDSGEEIWQKKFDNHFVVKSSLGDLSNSKPLIFFDNATSTILATSTRGNLSAFEPKTGEQLFNKALAISNSVWSCGSHIYFVSVDNYLVAASKADGSIAWRIELKKYLNDSKERSYWGAPIMLNSNILIINSMGKALLIDPANGIVLNEKEVPDNITAQPAVVDGSVYLLSNEGVLYIYRD